MLIHFGNVSKGMYVCIAGPWKCFNSGMANPWHIQQNREERTEQWIRQGKRIRVAHRSETAITVKIVSSSFQRNSKDRKNYTVLCQGAYEKPTVLLYIHNLVTEIFILPILQIHFKLGMRGSSQNQTNDDHGLTQTFSFSWESWCSPRRNYKCSGLFSLSEHSCFRRRIILEQPEFILRVNVYICCM